MTRGGYGHASSRIDAVFNANIAQFGSGITDDKSLDKAVRKELQVEHAATKSRRPQIIKLAHKTPNLRSLVKARWTMGTPTGDGSILIGSWQF
jgi:(p)ppGpp synthase/HD superfamily hydrolase